MSICLFIVVYPPRGLAAYIRATPIDLSRLDIEEFLRRYVSPKVSLDGEPSGDMAAVPGRVALQIVTLVVWSCCVCCVRVGRVGGRERPLVFGGVTNFASDAASSNKPYQRSSTTAVVAKLMRSPR